MTAFYNFSNTPMSQTVSYGLHSSGLLSKKKNNKKNK
jgi:hypothetical protein